MASIDRTAYPRFKRTVSAVELRETFTPSVDEIEWAQSKTRSDQHFLALVVLLKAFGRLGHFPDLYEVPIVIVEHIRLALELKPNVEPAHDSDRTLRLHKGLVRERLNIALEPERARAVAEQAIREAAKIKDNPADLINVALEELVRARLELPGYSTLDEMTATIRTAVNTAVYAGAAARMGGPDAQGLDDLLIVDPVRRRSRFDKLKDAAGAPTVTNFRDLVKRLEKWDALGPTEHWLEHVLPGKIGHFAGEARDTDANDLAKYGTAKRQTLLACLVHVVRIRTRDELATMLCKRMAGMHKKARERLEQLREANRSESERLLGAFGEVLAVVREALGLSSDQEVTEGRQAQVSDAVFAATGRMVLGALERSGGVGALSTAHEEVSAHHGNNYLPFVEKFYRSSRSALFDTLDVLVFEPTSADHSVFHAVKFLQGNRSSRGDHLIAKVVELFRRSRKAAEGEIDLSFASENWRKIIVDPRRPGKIVRRHFEACVFSYLASELRNGDMAVTGSESYANFNDQLLSKEECEPLMAKYYEEAGLPPDAASACAQLRDELETTARRVDAGYPANADLVISDRRPVLKRRKGKERGRSALDLEAAILDRMPSRGILEVLTRTAYLAGWTRHFGPPSGNDPKIRDALGRYVMLTFTYGTNLGPAQVARHMNGAVSAHELHRANKHADANKIHKASVDVINAYAKLDMTALYGDGSRVAADGT